jgi:hypothetical protein
MNSEFTKIAVPPNTRPTAKAIERNPMMKSWYGGREMLRDQEI